MYDDMPLQNYTTKAIYGHKIEHYIGDKFWYDEFQPLEIKSDTILDKLERLILTSLFFVTVFGIVYIMHCL
ncbi:MAG: hypothetical protein J6Y02_19500 [Pseudobutyrivibrio sp.]|nr:hypothetical protein [Pseudobutyrivibrio sp.]